MSISVKGIIVGAMAISALFAGGASAMTIDGDTINVGRGETYKLEGNVQAPIIINANDVVTLDLNGHKVYNQIVRDRASAAVIVRDGGVLILTDTSADKTGEILSSIEGSPAISNFGVLQIDGGHIVMDANNSNQVAVHNRNRMEMNGGTIEVVGKAGYGIRNGVVKGGDISLKITGGHITGGTNNVQMFGSSSVSISDGLFDGVGGLNIAPNGNKSEIKLTGGHYLSAADNWDTELAKNIPEGMELRASDKYDGHKMIGKVLPVVDPETPTDPEQPEQPTTPEKPVTPATPETPGRGDGSEIKVLEESKPINADKKADATEEVKVPNTGAENIMGVITGMMAVSVISLLIAGLIQRKVRN